ncbi:endogenous retrovirus group S71 member 1 Env polyprotein-like [Molossus nigricans]
MGPTCSQPNTTEDCWLCVDPAPPYYVGIGANATGTLAPMNQTFNDSDSPGEETLANCALASKLTLGDLQGQGTCFILGNLDLQASPYKDNCLTNTSLQAEGSTPWTLIAPSGTWFACLSGIHHCISPGNHSDLCVVIYIVPQVYLYAGPTGAAHFLASDYHTRLQKRVPILIPVLATLGIAGSTALRATALIKNDLALRELSATFSRDVELLQTQVKYLENRLTP